MLDLPSLPSLPEGWNPLADVLPIDGLDVMLLAPILLPAAGLWVLGASASSLKSLSAQLVAENELNQVKAVNKALTKKVAEGEERYERKMAFWQSKVDRDRKESIELLRSAKAELREKLRAAEVR